MDQTPKRPAAAGSELDPIGAALRSTFTAPSEHVPPAMVTLFLHLAHAPDDRGSAPDQSEGSPTPAPAGGLVARVRRRAARLLSRSEV